VVVGQIVDIVDEAIGLSTGVGGAGLARCAVIQQRVTELIDLEALVLSGGAALLDLYQSSRGVGAGPGIGAAPEA
jgi:hypothetical protein